MSTTISESRIPPATSTNGTITNSQNAPSGIGAGLAGVSRAAAAARDVAGITKINHKWEELAVLSHDDNSAIWKVRWVHDGQ